MTKKKLFPGALQVGFGDGRILVELLTEHDKSGAGLVLTDVGGGYSVSDRRDGKSKRVRVPEDGVIYLRFSNPESAVILINALKEVVETWPADDKASNASVPLSLAERDAQMEEGDWPDDEEFMWEDLEWMSEDGDLELDEEEAQSILDATLEDFRDCGLGVVADGTVYGNGIWLDTLRVVQRKEDHD